MTNILLSIKCLEYVFFWKIWPKRMMSLYDPLHSSSVTMTITIIVRNPAHLFIQTDTHYITQSPCSFRYRCVSMFLSVRVYFESSPLNLNTRLLIALWLRKRRWRRICKLNYDVIGIRSHRHYQVHSRQFFQSSQVLPVTSEKWQVLCCNLGEFIITKQTSSN